MPPTPQNNQHQHNTPQKPPPPTQNTTLVVGALSFFIKRTLSSLESNDQKNAEEIRRLGRELNDLKADLPLIYVTREDFIRIMNRVEDKLDLLLYNSPQEKRKEE